jgi:hypothetical protein
MNPNKPIPDDELGICRSPMVQNCRHYVMDGIKIDHCDDCASGFSLGEDGQCYYKLMYIIYAVASVLLVVVLVLVAWVVDMVVRPVSNAKELKEALAFRTRQLLHMRPAAAPVAEGTSVGEVTLHGHPSSTPRGVGAGPRGLWPLRTNLCRTDVAGPGMQLHFNFQAAVMLWAVLVAGGWYLLAFTVDMDLLILGTRKFGTPRDNCILVAWGYETQQKLMWAKVVFLWCAYLGSFILAIVHSVRQLRLFQSMDYETKTMSDFTAICMGVPQLPGTRLVEDDLKKGISEAASVTVVGVSVGWAYQEKEDEIKEAITDDLSRREVAQSPRIATVGPERPAMNPIRTWLNEKELTLFGPHHSDGETDMEELLKELHTSQVAFVVFDTEAARDKAVEKSEQEGGFAFEGSMLTLEVADCEPNTVMWHNLGFSSMGAKVGRLLQGIGFILLALLGWIVIFYAPYAWSVASFNYDNGQEPGAIYGLVFSMVVCVGNVIMYDVCSRVSEYVGFRFKDDKEAAYMVFYTVACTINIGVDMITTYFTAFTIMSELGFRTYDGTRLSDVPMFPQGFETYAIQRSLAENLWLYAFPSTFLIPFLIEPIPSVLIPLLLGKLIVGKHPEIKGHDAEAHLSGAEMEMGRYGDILLNMVLGILIFFFPGGYTAGLFMAMAGCHVYIYAFDHWRVLRAIPSCTFASMSVDWCCQAMLAPLCAIMAACLMFKSQNQEGFPNLSIWGNVFACSGAFIGHCVVHIAVLIYVVPRFSVVKGEDKFADTKYEDVAKTVASTWFSENPVHCLRSKFVYKHSPPCSFQFNGKEHLLEVNEKIGCYYSQEKEKTEYDDVKQVEEEPKL